jgi:AcrR family transcriptional regulator
MAKADANTTIMLSANGLVRPNRNEAGRLEILAAASEAFMRLGYARASIDEIADQLGATKGRVYHYYRSKADILMDVHRHVLDLMMTGVTPLAKGGGGPAEILRAMVHQHAMLVMENLSFTRVALPNTTDLLVAEKRDFVREINRARAQYEQMFVDVLERGMAEGVFRKADAALLVKPLLGSLNWTVIWYDDNKWGADRSRQEIADIIADYALEGVVRSA